MDIAIFGSCVSRDILSLEVPDPPRLTSYFARSSFGSAFAEPPAEPNPPQLTLTSLFQRRIVTADQTREFSRSLPTLRFDLLLVDFIDERFDLFLDRSLRPITVSNEAKNGGFSPRYGRLVHSGTDEFFGYWEFGWSRFVVAMRALGKLDRVVLNKVYWSRRTERGEDYLPSYTQDGIEKANSFLERMYARALRDLEPRQVLVFAAGDFVGSENHKWGKSPFHYCEGYYRAALSQLRSLGCIAEQRTLDGGRVPPADPRAAIRRDFSAGPLSTKPLLISIDTYGRPRLRVAATLDCGGGVLVNQALVQLAFPGLGPVDLQRTGLTLSTDSSVGAYRYLRTSPGVNSTDFSIELPIGCTQVTVGLRSWWPKDSIRIESAWIEVH